MQMSERTATSHSLFSRSPELLSLGDQTNFEGRWHRRKGVDSLDTDGVLAIWWSDIETLDETCEKEKGALTS